MGFRHAKAYRAENAGYMRGIKFFCPFFRQHTLFYQPIQGQQPDNIGLGFFQPGKRWTNGFTDVGLSCAGPSVCRPKGVADFVHQHHGKIAIHGSERRLVFTDQQFANGQHHIVHAGIHEILEEDLFAALFLMDSRIVRQIVRHRLIAVAQIACAKRRVHYFHRRALALE